MTNLSNLQHFYEGASYALARTTISSYVYGQGVQVTLAEQAAQTQDPPHHRLKAWKTIAAAKYKLHGLRAQAVTSLSRLRAGHRRAAGKPAVEQHRQR